MSQEFKTETEEKKIIFIHHEFKIKKYFPRDLQIL